MFNEIDHSVAAKDPVKLAAVLDTAPSLPEKELSRILDKVCNSSLTPISRALLALIERCDLSHDFIHECISPLTPLLQNEQEVVLSLLQAGTYRYLEIPVLLAGELRLDESVSSLHELLKIVTRKQDLEAIFSTLAKVGEESSSMGQTEGVQKLAECAKSSDVDIRNRALDALVSTGKVALPYLHDLLKSKESDVLITATNTLGFMGNKKSVKPLIKLTKKEDPNIRYAAFEALGRITSTLAILHLLPGVLDEEVQVRVAAVTALEQNIENPFTVRGLENFLGMRQDNIEAVAHAAVVADAKNFFLALSSHELFKELFFKYYYQVKSREDQQATMEFLTAQKRDDLRQDFVRWCTVRDDTPSLSVLVVDDSKIMHKIIESALIPLNHRTISAFNGREGLEVLEKEPIDIVLTDMNMPEMNGMEFVKKIRKEKKLLSLPIVMITTQSSITDKELAVAAGVNYFLTKPFKNEKLVDIFRDFLSGQRKRTS